MNNLGFIPSWQFNQDPAQNPNLTPFMQMPAGMYQTTVQPVGPYMAGMSGFGDLPVAPTLPTVPAAPVTFTSPEQLVDFHNQMMATWWWRNRRMVGIGLAVALGLGVVGGLSAILR